MNGRNIRKAHDKLVAEMFVAAMDYYHGGSLQEQERVIAAMIVAGLCRPAERPTLTATMQTLCMMRERVKNEAEGRE